MHISILIKIVKIRVKNKNVLNSLVFLKIMKVIAIYFKII